MGLSPGGVSAWGSTDFSELDATVEIPAEGPIFESFSDQDTFDLSNNTIRFEPAAPAQSSPRYFPRFELVPGESTEGIGFVNAGASAAAVTFTAFDRDGSGIRQVGPVFWPSGDQAAYQADGLLGLSDETSAWIEAKSDKDSLRGFFLSQSFPGGTLLGLDGAEVFDATYTSGIFPRVATSGFYSTEVYLANPGQRRTIARITGFDADTQYDGGSHVIEANGFLSTTVEQLFGEGNGFDGYLQVEATEGVIGNAIIRYGSETVSSSNMLPLDEASISLYASHTFIQAGVYFTEVSLINPLDGPDKTASNVTITAYDEGGAVIATPVEVQLEDGQIVSLRDAELGLPTDAPVNAWLHIQSDFDALIGSVTFGDPAANRFESTLPLQSEGTQELYFAQVANGNVGGVDYYTGLALVNPREQSVNVTIRVYASDGSLLGSVERTLSPGEKYIRLLKAIEGIGSLPDQASGYIHISADADVLAFVMFGDMSGNFLSAVPPQD